MRDIEIREELSPSDVRIEPKAVGVCGSDVHYYLTGRIGDFVVQEPMVLGHEASGVVVETGSAVSGLKVGDRVCVEPGIPDFFSWETLMGQYNLDPAVRFWATPPVHGCLRESVVHPASLTFKIPDSMSYHEGALAEPVAIGVYSAQKARIKPGDTALVIGAGTIGLVTAMVAAASGCSKIFLADIKQGKIAFADANYGDIIETVDLAMRSIPDALAAAGLSGVDVCFEASGSPMAYDGLPGYLVPGGRLVLIGMPDGSVPMDVVGLQVKEITVETIFRYANVFPKVVNLIASGRLNVKPLVTRVYEYAQSLEAIEYAATMPENDVKIMIDI